MSAFHKIIDGKIPTSISSMESFSSIFSKYKLNEKHIQKSQYGGIWKGRDIITDQKIVLKISEYNKIHTGYSYTTTTESPVSEIQINKYLSSIYKNIKCHSDCIYSHFPQLIDSVNSNGVVLTVYEDAGIDLYNYISKYYPDGMPDHISSDIFTKIVCALKYLHDNNIAHNDISIENICVSDNNGNLEVRIIDFGMSTIHKCMLNNSYSSLLKCINNRHCTNYCDEDNIWGDSKKYIMALSGGTDKLGKQGYRSPEIEDSHRSWISSYNAYSNDIFGIGSVLYIMLTGRRPFTKASVTSPHYKQFVTGAWCKNDTNNIKLFGDVLKNVTKNALDICDIIIKPEKTRADIRTILSHPWLKKD